MTVDFSILIPTHNRAAILARTLASLATVRLPRDIGAELIVVANACTDDTPAQVAAWTDKLPFPVRCVEEPTPGLNIARNRAAKEARGEILAYLDDDVKVHPGWLEGLYDTFTRTPADIVGGRVTLWWDQTPRPAWLDPRSEFLLTYLDWGADIRRADGPHRAVGANYAIKRAVLQSLGGFRPGLDRCGNQLLGGGETDLTRRALARGFNLYYAPQAWVEHWVAPKRVEKRYLRDVALGSGAGNVLMKETFGPREAGRAILGHGFLMGRHTLGRLAAGLRGDRRGMVRHELLACLARGSFRAACRRSLGKDRIPPAVWPGSGSTQAAKRVGKLSPAAER